MRVEKLGDTVVTVIDLAREDCGTKALRVLELGVVERWSCSRWSLFNTVVSSSLEIVSNPGRSIQEEDVMADNCVAIIHDRLFGKYMWEDTRFFLTAFGKKEDVCVSVSLLIFS